MQAHSQLDPRFAIYLMPPYSVVRMVTEIHSLIRKQFGFDAADRFQVHATIKGFFKKNDGPLEALIEELDDAMRSQLPFPVYFNGYHFAEVGFGLDVSRRNDELNLELLEMRERIVNAVLPFISPDCEFMASDLNENFKAHITLAFRDIPISMHSNVLRFINEAPKPTEPFTADTFHFLEFCSDDWTGPWWHSLSWRLIKTWNIG